MGSRITAKGIATPLARPTTVFPTTSQSVSAPISFQFTSSSTSFPITCEYVIQMSNSPTFTPGAGTYIDPALHFVSNAGGTISMLPFATAAASVPPLIRNAQTVYWRVGARNVQDVPGPTPDDYTKQRYIFSAFNTFTRPGGAPPPP